jgi:hypothetical protein
MLPDTRVTPWREGCARLALIDRRIARLRIIRPITQDLGDGRIDLTKPIRQSLPIAERVGHDRRRHHLAAGLVKAQVQFGCLRSAA